MWWALAALFGGAYVILRFAEGRSEWWVLAAIAFACTLLAINDEIDKMRGHSR